MQILLLNHGFIEVSPVLRNLSSMLQERGHSVDVIAYADAPPSRATVRDNGVREFLIYRGGDRLPVRPLRGALRFWRFGRAARRIIADFNPDVVVAFHFDSLVLARVLRGHRSRIVYYALEYSARPGLHSFWTGWGFLKLLERPLVRNADLVVSVEHNRAELQAAEWGCKTPLVVQNAPRVDRPIAAAAESRLAAQNRTAIRFVYAGGVYENTMIAEMVEAVAGIDGASLDIYGPVRSSFQGRFTTLLDDAASRGGSVRYCGSVNYNDLPQALVQYDVGVVLYGTGSGDKLNYQFAAPSKLVEYMKAGLPVVATPQPLMRNLIETTGAGWLVDGDVSDTLPALIAIIVADSSEVQRRGRKALQAFLDSLSYDVGVQPLLERIEALGRGS